MPESVSGVEAILDGLRRRAWTPTTPRVSVSLPDAEAAVLAAADTRTQESGGEVLGLSLAEGLAAAVLDVVRPLILREAAEAITGHDVARGASAVEAQRWLVGQSREDRVRAILAFAASDLERLADGTNDSAGGEST